MTTHDWFVENRTAYVSRALEPDEELLFREHLPVCAACRDELALIERELAWLPMGAQPVTPRPGLTRRLVEGALGRRRVPRWYPVALAASLLLAVLSWGWAAWRDGQVRSVYASRLATLEQALAEARDTLAIMRNASLVAQAKVTMGEHRGHLIIFADETTHRWNVVLQGVPSPIGGQICQFWFITEGGMVRSVEVRPGPNGTAFFTLGMPAEGGAVMGAALTLEPEGSASSQPKGPELAHLMLKS